MFCQCRNYRRNGDCCYRRNSDADIRALQRQAAQGDSDALIRLVMAKHRIGEIPYHNIVMAARLGHPIAMAILPNVSQISWQRDDMQIIAQQLIDTHQQSLIVKFLIDVAERYELNASAYLPPEMLLLLKESIEALDLAKTWVANPPISNRAKIRFLKEANRTLDAVRMSFQAGGYVGDSWEHPDATARRARERIANTIAWPLVVARSFTKEKAPPSSTAAPILSARVILNAPRIYPPAESERDLASDEYIWQANRLAEYLLGIR